MFKTEKRLIEENKKGILLLTALVQVKPLLGLEWQSVLLMLVLRIF